MTLKVAFLGHSYDFDMSSSHWGIEPGVNSVIFKVLIDKPIAYYWSIESGSKLKGTVPTSSSGCRISRLPLNDGDWAQVPCHRSMQACGGRIESLLRYMVPKMCQPK